MSKPNGTKKDDSKKEIEVMMSSNMAVAVYSDVAQIESTGDHVVLNFLQKTPPIGSKLKAQMVARVILSWPHLIRLNRVLTDTIKNNSGKAIDSFSAELNIEDRKS